VKKIYIRKFNNTKFEQFSMDSSTLSSNLEDIGSSSYVDFLQGSYQFNNCTFGTGILSTTIQNYQPENGKKQLACQLELGRKVFMLVLKIARITEPAYPNPE
jgi:hypothetical protein